MLLCDIAGDIAGAVLLSLCASALCMWVSGIVHLLPAWKPVWPPLMINESDQQPSMNTPGLR